MTHIYSAGYALAIRTSIVYHGVEPSARRDANRCCYVMSGALQTRRRRKGGLIVAGTYNRDQIRAALALTDPAVSSFLDLQTGHVVSITEGDQSPENQQLSALIMESYGDRFRYIPGGNPAADDAAVSVWLENEGLA